MATAAIGGRTTAPGERQLVPVPLPGTLLARSRRDPLGFLLGGMRRHGDVFRYRLGPLVFHLLAHPDHVRRVLVDNARNYPRSWYYGRTRVVVGEGLVTTEGAAWRRLRRMSQPAFHHDRIAALAGMMTDAIAPMLGRWHAQARTAPGAPIDVAAEFAGLTLRIAGRALLGIDLAGEADAIARAVTTALQFLEHRLSHLLAPPPWAPTPRNRRFRRALRELDALIARILAGRRARPGDEGDLLAMLLSARDEETGNGLTDLELRDQVLTFIGAGHETTAVGLAWTVSLLARHPGAADRVRAEAADAIGGRTPTAADLPRLPYTRRAIEESLRIDPPVYAVARDAIADDEIGGYRIPARSMVVLSPYVTHRHPEFWPDPEAFDPDRFLPDRVADRPRYAWYPFLGGPHQCIGQEFAMMEMVLATAMIARAFRVRPAPGPAPEPWPVLSLRPRDGVPVILEPIERPGPAPG
jgi:cytochrome P450